MPPCVAGDFIKLTATSTSDTARGAPISTDYVFQADYINRFGGVVGVSGDCLRHSTGASGGASAAATADTAG